jgi:uncharacterized damage-inducible protein DinB
MGIEQSVLSTAEVNMTVSVPQAAADLCREACETLVRAASATPVEKLTWQPLENGRSMLEQLAECTLANFKWARILRTGTYANLPAEIAKPLWDQLTTLNVITEKLRESTEELVSALGEVPVDQLAEPIQTQWGPMPLFRCCFHAYWNMVYHEGQINYIQTLYGDYEEHE